MKYYVPRAWPAKENWDSYGALPTTPEAIAAIDGMTWAPRNDGGVSLEGTDLEISFGPDGKLKAIWFETPTP